jgi:hypothetical protein
MSSAPLNLKDHRSNRRYPVDAVVEYAVVLPNRKVITGVGETVNLSSGGVLFQSEVPLPSGVAIELAIAWPARLESLAGMNLYVTGTTLRTQGNCTAVSIHRCEFRSGETRFIDSQPAFTACPAN